MATIDWATILEALISGLSDLKGAVVTSTAAPPTSKPPPVATLSAFLSMPAAAQKQLVDAGVHIVNG